MTRIFPAHRKPINAQEFAGAFDLTKPLRAADLERFSLEEITLIKKILVERARLIVGEIAALKERDKFARGQYETGMFRAEHFGSDGTKLFQYECEPRFYHQNIFVPGAWFKSFIKEREILRRRKQENLENFEPRQRTRLINELTAGH